FDDVRAYKAKLQKIAICIQDSFGMIQTISGKLLQPKEKEMANILPSPWLLTVALQSLEAELCDLEVAKFLDKLEEGTPWDQLKHTDLIGSPTSAINVLHERLDAARKQDRMAILQSQHECLKQVETLLRQRILPAALLLYSGLTKLRVFVTRIHAQCELLLEELQEFSTIFQIDDNQSRLDADDHLLIQLSDLLQVEAGELNVHFVDKTEMDTEEDGSLSQEAVLDKLKELMKGSANVPLG
ncbi:5457_t:CDS:2, partial [Acaulospora colombiana]